MADYRNTDKIWRVSPSTQKTANWLSPSHGRSYKYSGWQQIIGAITEQTDQINDALKRQLDNRFPSTFRNDSLDVIYTAPLPDTVGTLIDGSVTITESKYSNHEDWWYNTVPTGLQSLKQFDKSIYIDSATPLELHTLDIVTNPDAGLYVTLTSDDGSFIKNVHNTDQTPSKVTVTGLDVYGVKRSEVFYFVYSNYIRSKFKWQNIFKVETSLNDEASKFTLSVGTQVGYHLALIEDKKLRYADPNQIEKPLFWQWDSDKDCLVSVEFAANSISDLHAGIEDVNNKEYYALMSFDGSDFTKLTNINSFIPSETDDYLYVAFNNELLVYSKLDEYPSILKEASELRTSDPLVKLDVKREYDETIIKAFLNREQLNKQPKQYRFRIVTASGISKEPITNSLTEDNISWQDSTSSWNTYEGEGKFGFHSPLYKYNHGDLVLEDMYILLEVKLQDGTIERDTFILEKQAKFPVFQHSIAGTELAYSSDGFLSGISGSTYTEYRFRNDTYLTTDSQIIFAENYLSLENDSTPLSASAFNVFNELDQWGALHAIDRKSAEKSYDYKNRLAYAFHTTMDASTEGLTNALSTSLGLLPKGVAYYSLSESTKIRVANSTLFINDTPSSLYEYPTVSDLLDGLTAQGVSITVLDNTFKNLPGRSVVNFDNITHYDDLQFEDLTKFPLNIADDELLVENSIVISGYEKVAAVDMLSLQEKQFVLLESSEIVASQPLGKTNLVSYATVKSKGFIKASPVIITPATDMENSSFSYGYMSKFAQTLIKDAENNHPNKWSA